MRYLLLCMALIVSLCAESNSSVENNDTNETKLYIDHFLEGMDSMHGYVSHKVKVVSSNVDAQLTDWTATVDGQENNITKQRQTPADGNASVSMSEYFSSFFKDENFLNANNKSYLRVRFGPEWNQKASNQWKAQFSFNLNLPYTQDSLNLFIGEDVEDEISDKTPNPKAADPSIGVRWYIPDFLDNLKTHFSVGVRGIDPFARFYMKYTTNYYDWRIYPTQEFEYGTTDTFDTDRFFEETRLYFDRRISKLEMVRLLVRRSTDSEKEGQQYGATLSYFNTLNRHNVGFNAYMALSGDSRYFLNHPDYEPHGKEYTGIDNYRTGVVWKQGFLRDWLFYELEPLVEWDRRYEYDKNYIFRATLELWFGDS